MSDHVHNHHEHIYYKPPVNAPPLPPGAAVSWMKRPLPIPDCPHGLEYLTQIDHITMHQVPSLLEVFVGWDTCNKYVIKNRVGKQIFYAMEDTDTCMRICMGSHRGFTIYIIDNLNQRIMKITREFKFCSGCNWCADSCKNCALEVCVEAPIGEVIGYVRQKGSRWRAKYDVLNQDRQPVLKILGPNCICDGPFACSCENEFKLLAMDEETQIGKLNKDYTGFINEMFTVADSFTIQFPMDMSVKTKATLFGALFLIDFMFFENKDDRNSYGM